MAASAGDPLIVTEVWRGRLWSAVPHTLVSADDNGHITYLAPGATGAFASSRGVPGREGLPRGQRKLAALHTCIYTVVEVPNQMAPLATLHFFRPGAWARINVGWSSDGTFLGWYVNFEVPYRLLNGLAQTRVQTMDLVLDMVITPDYAWHWKDRDEFDEAVALGILNPELEPTLLAEAEQVLAQVDAREGPFAPSWIGWRPDPGWRQPSLPPELRAGGAAWR